MSVTFITGGARSGKSLFAEKLARECGKRVVYIATAKALDEEMAHRIAVHRQRRPLEWETVEESDHVSKVLKNIAEDSKWSDFKAVLIDCLAMLVSNRLLTARAEDPATWPDIRKSLLNEINSIIREAKELKKHVFVVSNEVGMGLVPEYPLGRIYRDLLGEANQLMALHSDNVYFMVSGIPLKIK